MSDAGKYRWMTRYEADRELETYAEIWYVIPPSKEVLFGIWCGPDEGIIQPGNESEHHIPDSARICRAMVPEAPSSEEK